MKRLKVFSWGYWGWGSHTNEFVAAVDAVERGRGRRPPIFADIRFSRSVRATGFRDAAFEKATGRNRYRWLRKLGNARIGSGRGGFKIADPAGVDELLQLVVDAEKQRRRVIYFCACEQPWHCHRAAVARLLIKSASRKGVSLSVVEWPGEEPKPVKLVVPREVVRNVLQGGNRVPLGGLDKEIHRFAALPWGTRVALHSDEGDIAIISGPAKLARHWYLPVVGPSRSKATDTVKSLSKEAARLRKSLGYAPF
jgi:hypothetical protein